MAKYGSIILQIRRTLSSTILIRDPVDQYQVQDGDIVVEGAGVVIEGLASEARVTRATRDALTLGFELTDGAKSMADIVLGKVRWVFVFWAMPKTFQGCITLAPLIGPLCAKIDVISEWDTTQVFWLGLKVCMA